MKSLSLARPHLLIMTGIPSSGKTFFAEKFSETFSAPFVSINELQKLATNSEQAAATMSYILEQLMKTSQSIIVETVADTRKDRLHLAMLAKNHGYQPMFIWVQTDVETARSRAARVTKAKSNRQLTREEHTNLTKAFVPLKAEAYVVISGKHTYATQAKVVLTKLSAPRASTTTRVEPRTSSDSQSESRRRNISIG